MGLRGLRIPSIELIVSIQEIGARSRGILLIFGDCPSCSCLASCYFQFHFHCTPKTLASVLCFASLLTSLGLADSESLFSERGFISAGASASFGTIILGTSVTKKNASPCECLEFFGLRCTVFGPMMEAHRVASLQGLVTLQLKLTKIGEYVGK